MNADLYEGFDYSVKLGSLFTAIRGIDLPIGEFDLPVRTYNSLHSGGITEIQQILSMSGDELMSALVGGEGRKREAFWYLIGKLEDFNINGIPECGKAENADNAIEMERGEIV